VPRFQIFSGFTLVGYSDLELGDAPMGVAAGEFLPTDAYLAIQPAVIAARTGSQMHLSLTARSATGLVLPAQGGVHILDYSSELGTTGLEVSVMGIGYPLYEDLFPEHVAAYRSQWGSS